MTIENQIVQFLDSVPTISPNCNYWVIRTEGGKHYDFYVKGGFVAIGYNNVPVSKIREAHDRKDSKVLRDFIEKSDSTIKSAGLATNQLLTFFYSIKKGDVIIIPSQESGKIHFGIVSNNVVYDKKASKENDRCSFVKRRKVTWIKEINRYKAHYKLQKIVSSHLAVFNVNNSKVFINRALFGFYKEGDVFHLAFDVKSQDPVFLKEFRDFNDALIEIAEDFLNDQKKSEVKQVDLVEVKQELSSPGFIELLGPAGISILVIGGLIFTACAASIQYERDKKTGKSKLNVNTRGWLNAFSKYKSDRVDDEIKLRKMALIEKFAEKHEMNVPQNFIDELAANDQIKYLEQGKDEEE